MKYLIYARVSPKGSNWTKGETSIPIQIGECEKFVLQQDPVAEFIYIKDKLKSGKNLNRAGMQRILSEIKSGNTDWDCLVIWHLDRLTRSLVDAVPLLEKLRDSGKGLMTVRQKVDMFTAGGRAMLYIWIVFAQYEREMNSERTKAKMVSIAENGGIPNGAVAFGYKREKGSNVPILDPEKADIVKDIFHSYIKGVSVDELFRRYSKHIKAKQTICNMLRKKMYTGIISYDGKEYPGTHKAIISLDIWQKANKRLPGKMTAPRISARKYDYLLSGMVLCHCGRHMTNYSVLKKGKRYFYYKCTDPACRNAINAEKLDNAILEQIQAAATDEPTINDGIDNWNQHRLKQMEAAEPQLKQLKKELSQLEEQESNIKKMFLSGIVNADNQEYWNTELSKLVREKNMIQGRLDEQIEILEANRLPMVTAGTIVKQAKHWAEILKDTSNPELKRNLLLARIQQIKCISKGEFRLDLVMTKSKSWQPREDSNLN